MKTMREFVMEAYKKEIEEGKKMFIKNPPPSMILKKLTIEEWNEKYEENKTREIETILDILDNEKIDYLPRRKQGWGVIVVFNLRGERVFTHGLKENGEIDLYYYSEEYKCKPCKIKMK